MDTSILIAKLIGPFMLVTGAAILIDRENLKAAAREFMASPALLFLAGLLALLPGLVVVIFHNLWVADWPVIITFYGWVMVLAGITRVLLPGQVRRLGATMMERDGLLIGAGMLNVALGAFLSYQGYLGG